MTSRAAVSHSGRKGGRILLAAIGSLFAVSLVFIFGDLDRTISGLFYSPEKGWFLDQTEPWLFLYRYGTVPGLVLTLLALFGVFVGSVRPRMRDWRRYFLLVLLTSILGGGVIVNSVLKPYWGRPRPRQIQEFGGHWTYRHLHQPGTPGKGQSFPCGHCTMGYLFVSLFFLYPKSRRSAVAGGTFGVLYGTVIGMGRIAQGAHFASDVFWSFGVMLLVPLVLHHFVLKIPDSGGREGRKLSPEIRRLMAFGMAVAAVAISLVFLTRRPFYETYHQTVEVEDRIRHLRVHLDVPIEKSRIEYTGSAPGQVLVHARGFGWATASYGIREERRHSGDSLILIFHIQPRGYFSELTHRVEVILPERRKETLDVTIGTPDG